MLEKYVVNPKSRLTESKSSLRRVAHTNPRWITSASPSTRRVGRKERTMFFDKQDAENWLKWGNYPCTIFQDRYGGTFSGGWWNALPIDLEKLADGPQEDDVMAMMFWESIDFPYGKGDTPDAAYQDLVNKLQTWITE